VAVADSGTVGCGWIIPEGTTLQVVSLDTQWIPARPVTIPFPDTIRAFRIHALDTDGWLVTVLQGNTLHTLMYDPFRRKVVWGPRMETQVDLQNVRVLGFSRTLRNEPVVFGYDSLNHALGFARYDADSGHFLPFTPHISLSGPQQVEEADLLWLGSDDILWALSLKATGQPFADSLAVIHTASQWDYFDYMQVGGVPIHHPRWSLDPSFPFLVLVWAQAKDTLPSGGYAWEFRLYDGGYPRGVPVSLPDTLSPAWMPVPARWFYDGFHAFWLNMVVGMDDMGLGRDGWWLAQQGVRIPTRYQMISVLVPLAVEEHPRPAGRKRRVRVLPGRRVEVESRDPVVIMDLMGRRVSAERSGNILRLPRAGVYVLRQGKTALLLTVP
jgi:hypothetical protein